MFMPLIFSYFCVLCRYWVSELGDRWYPGKVGILVVVSGNLFLIYINNSRYLKVILTVKHEVPMGEGVGRGFTTWVAEFYTHMRIVHTGRYV